MMQATHTITVQMQHESAHHTAHAHTTYHSNLHAQHSIFLCLTFSFAINQVYIAFLGYYSTMCKRVGCSPADLVAVANKYIPWLFSLSMPPALEASQVGKMRLKYVPGIRIESGNRRP